MILRAKHYLTGKVCGFEYVSTKQAQYYNPFFIDWEVLR
jgi:hypothetical protein